MIPTHWLHVYQKPKIGSGFIRRYPALNYKHRIINMGGDDTMSCDLHVTRAQAEQIFTEYIGNRVAVYVDNPAMHIWEGLITRITIRHSGIESTISIDEMANKVSTIWRDGAVGGGTPDSNYLAASANTSSQALYGIKESNVNAGYERGTNNSRPTALQSTYLALHSWPIISTKTSSSAPSSILSIEAKGFYHTLSWEKLWTDATTQLDASVMVTTALANMANGTTFFDNTDTSQVMTNTTFSANQDLRSGITMWDIMTMMAEPGDGASRYIAGIEPTSSGRRLYYKAANANLIYTARTSSLWRSCAAVDGETGWRVPRAGCGDWFSGQHVYQCAE